jgi:Xaa-Pro aminopeptidase
METKMIKSELSRQEKERRWSLVRERMRQESLAAIIVYGDTGNFVPTRYLTNTYPTGGTQQVLFFPVDGDPVFLVSLGRVEFFAKRTSWVPPENIYSTVNWPADVAKHVLALKLQNKRIGIDSYVSWPTRAYLDFRKLCPDVELVEVRRMLSEIRGPKSSEEIRLMEEAIRIGELAQRTFLAHLKPGLKEQEVVGKVEDVVRSNGIDLRLWLMSSTPELPYPDLPGENIIRKPNPVVFSSEFVRTTGYACQVVRTYCWEEPKGEYKRMWELWKELRDMILIELRPGREITDVGAKVEDMVNEWGFECDYLGHAVGLNQSDAPYISSGPRNARYMQWTIMPNEVYVFHPMIRVKGKKPPLAYQGDMYLVGEDSTKWMTPFLPGLPEMIHG